MKLKQLVILFIAASTLFSCKKDEDGDPNSLVGSWVSVSDYWKNVVDGDVDEGTYVHSSIEDQVRLTFKADGTAYTENYDDYDKEWERDEVKYKVQGDQLVVIDGDDTSVFTFSIDNGNLVLYSKEVEGNDSYEYKITFKRR